MSDPNAALARRVAELANENERLRALIRELCPKGAVRPMVQSPGRAKVNTYLYLSKGATATLKEVTDAGNTS